MRRLVVALLVGSCMLADAARPALPDAPGSKSPHRARQTLYAQLKELEFYSSRVDFDESRRSKAGHPLNYEAVLFEMAGPDPLSSAGKVLEMLSVVGMKHGKVFVIRDVRVDFVPVEGSAIPRACLRFDMAEYPSWQRSD